MQRRVALLLALAAGVAAVAIAAGAPGDHRTVLGARAGAAGWADVAPIFAAKCVTCHSSAGIAPFSLAQPRAAAANAGAILAAVSAGTMPPWMPGRDSPAYVGQPQRILTPAEKDLIARWVRDGARTGTGRAPVPPPPAAGGAGSTLELAPAKAYLPRPAVGGLDDYHCFLLEPRLTRDMFVTDAVVHPQQPGIVHHVILFEAAGENAREARQLDRGSDGNGWTCFGGPGLSETRPQAAALTSDSLGAPEWITAWVPGHTTTAMPPGTGVLLHAGAAVVMQVHYNLSHALRPDRSRATLRVVPASEAALKPLHTMVVPAPVEIPCPRRVSSRLCSRGAALAREAQRYGREAALIPSQLLFLCGRSIAPSSTTSCVRRFTRPVRIYGVAGHMHLRGVDIRLELNPGTAHARTLLHIPRWNFHWQDAYYLAHPIDADAGDRVRVTCHFDNAAARQPIVNGTRLLPRYVLWGEGTTDEMCLGLLGIADR